MSDEDYSELASSDDDEDLDKILINTRGKRKLHADEEEVLGFGSELEDEEDEEDDEEDNKSANDLDSDFDDETDKLPDDRAWGSRRKNFYNTDYVDQDYSGIYKEKEIETAELEEQEARNIQKRLVEQLNEADFSIAELSETLISQQIPVESEQIVTDISQLTKRQKLDLLEKEAPEFKILVDDFNAKMIELRDKINPILKLVEQGKIQESSAVEYLKIKHRIISNYCMNIVAYLMLKAKRVPVKEHPVLKALYRYRQILNQLASTDSEIIDPQIDALLLGGLKSTANIKQPVNKMKMKKNKKNRLGMLKKADEEKPPEEFDADMDDDLSEQSAEELEVEDKSQEKRAITYEMAKNKGLTPKRSKEQRNPRVKHRNKYRKAMIRRRGQVRIAKSEIPVYAGEPTGIKIGLTRGRKLQ